MKAEYESRAHMSLINLQSAYITVAHDDLVDAIQGFQTTSLRTFIERATFIRKLKERNLRERATDWEKAIDRMNVIKEARHLTLTPGIPSFVLSGIVCEDKVVIKRDPSGQVFKGEINGNPITDNNVGQRIWERYVPIVEERVDYAEAMEYFDSPVDQ